VGVIATHEEYPIERMRLDRRAKWLGSVSHDECIKLTDVENMLEDSDDEGEEEDEEMGDGVSKEAGDEEKSVEEDGSEEDEEEEEDSDSDVDMDDSKRSKKEGGKSGMGDMGRTHRNAEEGGFFDDL
jgi:hypothetical protein